MEQIGISIKSINNDIFDLLDGKNLEKDLANLRKSKKISLPQLKKLYEMGVAFYNAFQLKEAEAIFTSYTFLNPYDHRGPGCLASIYLEQGLFRRALDVLNVLKTYPHNDLDETMLNIALCHYKLKEFRQASSLLLIVNVDKLSEFNVRRYRYLCQQLSPYIKINN
ncbi:tetratricopeptide repeat protein [Citrobacter portucalensis]|uniref:tetratricopeptide repeat protein n=1 Tax=Citrobacter portucalensis TaxID=1639133 RepID=UPI00226B44CF|nr:regulator [Citrobacter portucalensis]MCX8986020.1 regulator [Citrobacter portucalensis]